MSSCSALFNILGRYVLVYTDLWVILHVDCSLTVYEYTYIVCIW